MKTRSSFAAAALVAACFTLSGFAFSCAAPAAEEAAGNNDALTSEAEASRTSTALVVGGDHSCLLGRRGIKCWGRNTNGQITIPALQRPRALTAGSNHTCAIDDTGVKCWGSNISSQLMVPTTLRNPRSLSAGGSHTCAVDDEGVKCWGLNTNGQTTVPALRNPRQVSAGGSHTCAIDDDGVKCWGRNTSGQATPPVLVAPTRITLGTSHSCALDAEGVKCWGLNTSQQTTVPALNRPRDVIAGGTHNCALDEDGTKCWGSNVNNQVMPVPAMRRPSQLTLGRAHSCALDDDEIRCWGANANGQVAVPLDVEVVGRHVCLLTASGVRCAGDNERGQLGVGSDTDQLIALSAAPATDLGAGFESPSQLALGRAFGCALGAGGAVKCWGYNAFGQLGLGDTRERGISAGEMGDALPVLAFGDGPATRLAAGDSHACAIRGGALYCWGKGGAGQLGTESSSDVGASAKAPGPILAHMKPGLTFRDVALGRTHSCALSNEGTVFCFGSNEVGQLGRGVGGPVGDRPGTMGDAMQPVNLGDGFKVKAIASGIRHTCALSENGRVKCWGGNGGGELGLGDARDRGLSADDLGNALPAVDLGHGQIATELACGARHCCARTVQNTLKCWGDNAEGQLGLGDVAPRGKDRGTMGDSLNFVLTPPQERVRSMIVIADRTCATTDSGTRCWGRNRAGELGYGDRTARGGTLTTVPRLLSPLGI